MFCQNLINLEKDKYVFLGTYNGENVLEKSYFHFDCWREYYNSHIKEKAKNTLKDATKKVTGMMRDLGKMLPQMQRGYSSDQTYDMGAEIPDMKREIPEMKSLTEVFNTKEGEKKKCKKKE